MSLCDRYEATQGHAAPRAAPAWTPEAREQAQEEILARWLAYWPSERKRRLVRERERVGLAPPVDMTLTEGRVVRTLTALGHTRTIREWSAATGISEQALYWRRQQQWPPDQIVSRADHRASNGQHARAESGQFEKGELTPCADACSRSSRSCSCGPRPSSPKA